MNMMERLKCLSEDIETGVKLSSSFEKEKAAIQDKENFSYRKPTK